MSTKSTKLTDTQHDVLVTACRLHRGRIEWFPATVNGGARTKVLAALESRGLAKQRDGKWRATPAAYVAMGLANEDNTDMGATEATPQKPRRTRENSKQATMIAMLQRDEGATMNQLTAELEWLPHTVRGAMAGILKKKLGLNVVSDKGLDGVLVYRIA